MRGDQLRAAPNAIELARLARDRNLNMWSAFGAFLEGWATAESGALGGLECIVAASISCANSAF